LRIILCGRPALERTAIASAMAPATGDDFVFQYPD
jgi:hypothetical protein